MSGRMSRGRPANAQLRPVPTAERDGRPAEQPVPTAERSYVPADTADTRGPGIEHGKGCGMPGLPPCQTYIVHIVHILYTYSTCIVPRL